MKLRHLWERFIYGGLGDPGDRAAVRRTVFLNALTLFAMATLAAFGFFRLWAGNWLLGVVDLSLMILIGLNLVLLRLTRRISLSCSIGLALLTLLFLFLYATGGDNGTGAYWLYLYPVVAFFLFGKKGGFAWVAMFFALMLALHLAAQHQLAAAAYPLRTALQILGILLVQSMVVSYYAGVMETEEANISRRNRDLLQANQALENEMAQRQKAENELLRISQAVRSSSDAISIEDFDGTHLYHNRAFFNLLGYSITGLNAAGGAARLFRDQAVPEQVFRQLSEGRSWAGEVEVVAADGSLIQADLRADAVGGSGGRVIGMVMAFTDIRQRKVWEKALVESEERFRKVVASISDHIYMTSYQPDGAPVNLYLSPNIEKLTGYPHKTFLDDWNFWADSLIVPEDLPAARAQVDSFRKGLDSQTEYRIRRSDGRAVWVRDSGRVERQGDSLTVFGVVSDISANKYQEEIRESLLQELQKANQELTEFAYIVSHDLKAPLRAISSLAQWIGEDYRAALDEEGRQKIGLLLGRTKRMHNLIEGVLAYSRLGRMKPTLCPVDCQEEVKQVIDLLAPPQGIRVEVRGELPEIVYDRVHFVQVMQNLIGNAVKYHNRPNGLVEISCREGAGEWEFCVADDGPGIDPQHHDRIFKIFQSLQARDEVESTGIGLTIVKKIVEQYGGKIRLDSEPGRGSRFSFTVPRGLKAEDVECRKHMNG